MIGSHLPDYVLTEAEDRTRRRSYAPSNISPWAGGVSKMTSLTVQQCEALRSRGINPAQTEWIEGKNWMWVCIPVTDPFEINTRVYGRAVQHLAVPILRTLGDRIEVLTPRGQLRPVYAGGRISKPERRKAVGGFLGR